MIEGSKVDISQIIAHASSASINAKKKVMDEYEEDLKKLRILKLKRRLLV